MLTSPFTEENVKRLARKSYQSLSSSLVQSNQVGESILLQLIQQIKKEIKHICSDAHNSILRESDDSLKKFSWDNVWRELLNGMPILIKILSELCQGDRQLICLMASMILKKKFAKMGLIQRVISILMYGNATNTQVFSCLQPLMICLSYDGTIKLLDRLIVDYDADVLCWSNSLLSYLQVNIYFM
jgi:L1 cell adhesion molecule like protein